MSRFRSVETELSHFIEAGKLMDEPLRRFTAQLLFDHLYQADYEGFATLEASDIPARYPNWATLLRQLLQAEDLRALTRHNEDFAYSVTRETLRWCQETYLSFQADHSYQSEQQELDLLAQGLREAPLKAWEEVLDRLEARYPGSTQNWAFYRQTMGLLQQTDGPQARRELQALKRDLLDVWQSLLHAREHATEASFLEGAYARYHRELMEKVEQLQAVGDLLTPFASFLGEAWGDTLDNWDRIDWGKMEDYAQTLGRNRELRELADLLGRWEQEEKIFEQEERHKPLPKEIWRPTPYGKSEITGIHQSNDLAALIPSEIALLSSPLTETVFAKHYAEKKLLTFQYRSQEKGTETAIQPETEAVAYPDVRGPFIVCLDTSGSMFGAPERVAKALTLAILNRALQQGRQAMVISFSTGYRTQELNGLEKDMGSMIEFLLMSFHGATDLQPALEKALQTLEEEAYERADVLVVSDFLLSSFDPELVQRVQRQRQEHGTHFHSMYITRGPDMRQRPLPIFDNHWAYDLNQRLVMRQLVQHFHQLTRPEATETPDKTS